MIVPSSVFHLLLRPPPDRCVIALDLRAPGRGRSPAAMGRPRPNQSVPFRARIVHGEVREARPAPSETAPCDTLITHASQLSIWLGIKGSRTPPMRIVECPIRRSASNLI